MKLKMIKFSLITGLLLCFFTFWGLNVGAAETSSTVTTQYDLFDNLSISERNSIISEKPNALITHDQEDFKLIYRKANHNISVNVNSNVTPTKNNVKKISNNSLNNLPKTGEKNKKLYWEIGLALIIIMISLSLWYRKKLKIILMISIIISFVGYSIVAKANENKLPNISTQNLSKGTSIFAPDIRLNGYEYVGYIHTYSDNEPVNEIGNIIVKYQDTDGMSVTDDVILTGTVGDAYSAEQKMIEGYSFKEVQGKPMGTYTKEEQIVTFIYEKYNQKGTVTVKYQDMEGNPLISDQSVTNTIGALYNFEIKVFEGYNFKEIVGEASGTILNETKIVIMKYVKLSKISISIDVPESNDLIGTEQWYQSLHHPIYIEDENGVIDSNGLKYKGPYTISGFYAPIDDSDGTIGPRLETTNSIFFGEPNDTYTMPDSFPYPIEQSEFSKYLGVIYIDENGIEKRSLDFSYKNEDIGSAGEGMVNSSYRVTYYGSVPNIPSQFENYDQNIVYTLFATYP